MHIVNRIWNLSSGRYGTYATIQRFRDKNFKINDFQETPVVKDMPPGPEVLGKDQYFSALTFNPAVRRNENFCGARLLFADLDRVDPRTLDYRPTIAWETSPGSYQAVWELDRGIGAYEPWADLNKRMTYAVGADKGGWMGSKLLRVPMTTNWKRYNEITGAPTGNLLWTDGPGWGVHYLNDKLPRLEKSSAEFRKTGYPSPTEDKRLETIDRLWSRIGLRTRAMLMDNYPKDRSLHIVRCIYRLKNEKFTDQEIWDLLWFAPWNKWRQQGNPERMWAEIQEATL